MRTSSHQCQIPTTVGLICVIFRSEGVVQKTTLSQGSGSSGNQIPTRPTGKYPSMCPHAPIRGGNFPARYVHALACEWFSSHFFFENYSSVGVAHYFRLEPDHFSLDPITGIKVPVIFRPFPARFR